MYSDRKVALITGGARGLGLETGRQLAEKGFHVIIAARDAEAAEAAANGLRVGGYNASSVQLDVASDTDRQGVHQHIGEKFGKLDVLVNNAGVLLDGPDAGVAPTNPPGETPPSVLRNTFEVNFFGPIFLTQMLLPLLKKSEAPRIVNVSSVLGSLTMLSEESSPAYHARFVGYNTSKPR